MSNEHCGFFFGTSHQEFNKNKSTGSSHVEVRTAFINELQNIADGEDDDRWCIDIVLGDSGTLDPGPHYATLNLAECRELGAKLLGLGMDPSNPDALLESLQKQVEEETQFAPLTADESAVLAKLNNLGLSNEQLTEQGKLFDLINTKIKKETLHEEFLGSSHSGQIEYQYRIESVTIRDTGSGQIFLCMNIIEKKEDSLGPGLVGTCDTLATQLLIANNVSVHTIEEAMRYGNLNLSLLSNSSPLKGVSWKKY